MSTCPNCSYKLVLLSRGKYKCALCSKLYPKKEIESKTFRNWNKLQRELDQHNLNLEIKRLNLITEEIKIFKNFRLLFKEKKKYRTNLTKQETQQRNKIYYQKNKEKRKQQWKTYYNKNKQRILERNDIWRKANKERNLLVYKKWLADNPDKRKNFLKAYRVKNLSLEQQKGRLAHWRKKQTLLTDAYLKNTTTKASTIRFFPFSPTFALCELLMK